MAKQISTTYGDALFELAVEDNNLDSIFEEMKVVKESILQNEELLKLLNHPKIVKEEKIKVIENIFKSRISDDVVGLVTLMVKKDRQNEIVEVVDYFIHRYMEYKNIGLAKVTSAVKLSGQQKEAINNRLIELSKYVEFEIQYTVDPSIIGGLIIRVEDRVVDSSIKSKIENISKSLSKVQII